MLFLKKTSFFFHNHMDGAIGTFFFFTFATVKPTKLNLARQQIT